MRLIRIETKKGVDEKPEPTRTPCISFREGRARTASVLTRDSAPHAMRPIKVVVEILDPFGYQIVV
jgi:hypothetical protein